MEVRNDQEPDKRSRFDLLLTKKLFAAFKRICEFLDLGSLEQFESCCVQAKTGDDTWKTALDIEKQKRLVEVKKFHKILNFLTFASSLSTFNLGCCTSTRRYPSGKTQRRKH